MKIDNPYLLFKNRNILFWLCLPFLYLLSLDYYLIISTLKFAYRIRLLPTYRPKIKVISVGNVTLGGTGKTPLVEWIVKFFIQQNKTPGIIIRGYKRPKIKDNLLATEKFGYLKIGDEASMLKEHLADISICVGRDKVKNARQLEKDGCDVAIIDDGFQHWRLLRDLDIVTIDTSILIADQRLLPVGRLREPLDSLKRADVFFLTKTDLLGNNHWQIKEQLKRINPNALIVSSVYLPLCFYNLRTDECIDPNSGVFKDKPVFILAGIANPIYFDQLLSKLKLKIKRELIYPDHHQYKKEEIGFIKQLAKNLDVNTIITTHKDAVRLKRFLVDLEGINLFYLKIQLQITENEEKFSQRLLSLFNS